MSDQTTVTLPPPRGGRLFQALCSVKVEPELAYGAAEDVLNAAGDNVVAQITKHVDARIDTQGADLKA